MAKFGDALEKIHKGEKKEIFVDLKWLFNKQGGTLGLFPDDWQSLKKKFIGEELA